MSRDNWQVGYSSVTGKYVPVPIFGDMSYSKAKAECKRLNRIKVAAKEKHQKRNFQNEYDGSNREDNS